MMRACGQTDKGIVRRDNQDYFQIEQTEDGKLILCVVCDGMGGARAGNVASRMAAETFVEELSTRKSTFQNKTMIQPALCDAVIKANRVVFDGAKAHGDYKGMGTTLVGGIIRRNKAHIINVGDSRAYRISKQKITRLTRDHSLVEDMIFRGDITPEEARNHPNKNLITRAVGIDNKVLWDLYDIDLKAGDRLLLCADGLVDIISDEELLEEVNRYEDVEKCCEMLIHLALARGGPDNVTALMVNL